MTVQDDTPPSPLADEPIHLPILLDEVVGFLGVRSGGCYIDATANGGGHTRAILAASAPDGRVLAIDRDADLIERLERSLCSEVDSQRLLPVCASFDELATVAEEKHFLPVDGILFDLGLSSYHLDHSARGFTYSRAEPLDMRFAPQEPGTSAAHDLIATAPASELTRIFRELGEERFASRIARSIVSLRERQPIATTTELFDVIERSLPPKTRWRASRHAARIFQALRIEVNDELNAIRAALPLAWECIAPRGRIVVLSFHSLEDRIVKHYFREQAQAGRGTLLVKRPQMAGEEEIERNPRAASAKLRAIEKA